jgi:hypothetical protein
VAVKAEQDLELAKAELAATEAELQAARGLAPGQPESKERAQLLIYSDFEILNAYGRQLEQQSRPPVSGSVADKLRGLIDKRIKLDLKEPVPFNRAMAGFVRQAGLSDLTIRYPEWASAQILARPPMVGPLVGEQTVAGWLQLILNDFNGTLRQADVLNEHLGKYDVYIRDYGLLITKVELAPPDAPTLAEFARQIRAEPEPKK